MDLNPEEQTQGLLTYIQSIVHIEWLSTALTAVIALTFTAVLARLVSRWLRHVLSYDNAPLTSSSIFVNIARVAIWGIGISVVLATCFGVDVSAAVTALGVGGIAISLGFQDTLSNLIGGLQVSITGLVKPGDHVSVGGQSGFVHDVTWRHTAIETAQGELIVVPNSVINKASLTKLPPAGAVTVPVCVAQASADPNTVAAAMEAAANKAVLAITNMEKPAQVSFSELTDGGLKGSLSFTVADDTKASAAKDAALRAVAPIACKESL